MTLSFLEWNPGTGSYGCLGPASAHDTPYEPGVYERAFCERVRLLMDAFEQRGLDGWRVGSVEAGATRDRPMWPLASCPRVRDRLHPRTGDRLFIGARQSLEVPKAPEDLSCTPGRGAIDCSWTHFDADHYRTTLAPGDAPAPGCSGGTPTTSRERHRFAAPAAAGRYAITLCPMGPSYHPENYGMPVAARVQTP